MRTERYDVREFRGTYFALRIGLILAALVVVLAPLSVWVADGTMPPSISDSWYTDAQMVFVLGLAAAGGLLLVVRGDTLTEQTFLNMAGGLGLIVAGAACWPKDDNGKSLKKYDPDVATLNEYAIGVLLLIGFLAVACWIILARFVDRTIGADWHVQGLTRLALRALPVGTLAVLAILFFCARDDLVRHVHLPAAGLMFALLGLVALLRTSRGVRLLEHLGDTPVDAPLSAKRSESAQESGLELARFDSIYATVAGGLLIVVAIALALIANKAEPGWVLAVEFALLALFAIFWLAQTWEAWLEQQRHDARAR